MINWKKILILVIGLLAFMPSFAATIFCPTIAEIKNNDFKSWMPLYKENEELAFDEDVEQFKSAVTAFFVAKWDKDYLENGHCFYRGQDPILDRIVFVHDAFQPGDGKWQWTTKTKKLAECYSSEVNDCEFIS